MVKKTIVLNVLPLVMGLNGFAGGDPTFRANDPVSRAITSKGKTLQQFCLQRELENNVSGKCLLSQFGMNSKYETVYDFQGNVVTSGGGWAPIGPVFSAELAKKFLIAAAAMDFKNLLESLQDRSKDGWQFIAVKVDGDEFSDFVLQLNQLGNANATKEVQDYVAKIEKEKADILSHNKGQLVFEIIKRIHSVHGGAENLEQKMRDQNVNVWRSYISVSGAVFSERNNQLCCSGEYLSKTKGLTKSPESLDTGTMFIPFEFILNSDGTRMIQAAVVDFRNMRYYMNQVGGREGNEFWHAFDRVTLLQVAFDNRIPNMDTFRFQGVAARTSVNLLRINHGDSVKSYLAPTGEFSIGYERTKFKFDSDVAPETPGALSKFFVPGFYFLGSLGAEANLYLGKGFHLKSNYDYQFNKVSTGSEYEGDTNLLNNKDIVFKDPQAAKDYLTYQPNLKGEDGTPEFDGDPKVRESWAATKRVWTQKFGIQLSKRFGKKHPVAITAFYNRVLTQEYKVDLNSSAVTNYGHYEPGVVHLFKNESLLPYFKLPVQQAGLKITF